MTDIVRNDDSRRFELITDGRLSQLVFERDEDALVLVHTEVPTDLEGHGIAGRLVQAALDDASEHRLAIVPVCPYVRTWLEHHPDQAERVEVRWVPSPREASTRRDA